jgi:AcrR family transcriptional regulator
MNGNPNSAGAATRPLRDRLREETSRAILEAAEAVLAEEGLQARMEQIAARAGVAVGTLYNHFDHRDGLVGALLRARRESLLARIDAALEATAGRPFGERLRAYLGAGAEHARIHGGLLTALAAAGEGPNAPRPPAELFAALLARADALVAEGVACGALRPDPAGVYGQALVGMSRALLFRPAGAGGDRAGVVDALADLFLSGARA